MENLNKKTKMKWILVVVVKCRHRENGLVGTLRSDDGDGNKNVIRAIGLIRKATTLHVHRTFLYTSLTILHDYDVKMANFMFYRGRKQATTKFSFYFLTWLRFLGIQLQESSLTFDKERRWCNRDEDWKTANPLFKQRFTCRRRPRILKSMLSPCCLALTALTHLGEPKCLHGEKPARIGVSPYHHKRVTRLGRPLFLPSQVLKGNVGKVGSPRVARVEGWVFCPVQLFSI